MIDSTELNVRMLAPSTRTYIFSFPPPRRIAGLTQTRITRKRGRIIAIISKRSSHRDYIWHSVHKQRNSATIARRGNLGDQTDPDTTRRWSMKARSSNEWNKEFPFSFNNIISGIYGDRNMPATGIHDNGYPKRHDGASWITEFGTVDVSEEHLSFARRVSFPLARSPRPRFRFG